MCVQRQHQELLDHVESELNLRGCVVERNYREQMACMLDRIDHVATLDDVKAFYAELRHERNDPSARSVCSPAVWLQAVECA